jgi:DNA sulfur modification protein DndD
MIILHSLTIKNFGPFRGKQTIDFPREGIVIVYGENMRGKTSLLNAIRYVLFGKVLGRGSIEQSLHQYTNWEEAEEGHFGFSIILEFSNDGFDYELTRTFAPSNGVLLPTCDADYTLYCFLKKNDVVLSSEDMNLEISRIIPEQVSRFFLFDGELLQEYEELLRQESEMGDKITRAIERILGVPVLINSRIDIGELHKKAQKQASLAAQQDQKTQELGNHMEDLAIQRQTHETELARVSQEKENLLNKKARLDEELRSFERIKAWLDEVDNLVAEVKGIESQIEEKNNRRKEYLAIAWRSILNESIRKLENELEDRREILQNRVNERTIISLLKQTLTRENCLICAQDISETIKNNIIEKISRLQTGDELVDINDLEQIIFSIKTLLAFKAQDVSLLVKELSDDLDHLRIDHVTKQDRIKDIEKQAKDFDQSKVRALYGEQANVIKKIGAYEEAIKAEETKIKSLDVDIRNLEKKIREAGGDGSYKERKRSELYSRLFDLYEQSISLYREKLRKKVEEEATRLFLQLTSEPDYSSLKITDTYGLLIVHKDGKKIPIRSAGAEHIVALSLMGSLHRNAPLSGPIIMDSPFGRLDETHTSKVVKALPEMAGQVILLVYKSELLPAVARQSLLGALKAEYKLVRQTARHTTIERNIGE